MNAWQLAFTNIKRQKLISILLVVSMGLSFGTIGLLYRLEQIAQSRWSKIAEFAPLIVGAKQSGLDHLMAVGLLDPKKWAVIPYRLFQTIRERQGLDFEDHNSVTNRDVDLAVPLLFMAKTEQKNWLLGTELQVAEMFRRQNIHLASGSWFFSERGEYSEFVVVGSDMGLKPNDFLQVEWTYPTGELSGLKSTLKVSGVLQKTGTAWDQAAFADLKQGWKIYNTMGPEKLAPVSIWGVQILHYFLVSTVDGHYENLESLVNQRSVALLSVMSQEKQNLQDLVGDSREFGLLVSGLVLSIGFVVLFSLMVFRFQSQNRSLAILRAIGISNQKILGWLTVEAVLLLLSSLALGELISFIIWLGIKTYLLQITFLTNATWPLWAWPVWGAGSAAFFISLVAPFIFYRQSNLHETIRI